MQFSLKMWCLIAHPDLYSLINVFELIHGEVVDSYIRRLSEKAAPKYSKTVLDKYTQLENMLTTLKNNEINLEKFFNNGTHLINFSIIIAD